jgi:hypothetical protein
LTNSAAAAAASDEFIADNIQLALGSTNYKQQKTRRYHILQHLAWYSLLLIFNWPLAAPAPAICKKPQGTIFYPISASPLNSFCTKDIINPQFQATIHG